jgi:Zn-dependent protease
MIPVQPLDGSKIIAWNTYAYFGIIIAIFSVAALYWSIAPIS